MDVKNTLVQQQQCKILKTTDEFNKIQEKYDRLIHENIQFKEHFKILQNNLTELIHENKSLKLINNNEIIKKVTQLQNLIKTRVITNDKEFSLFEDIKYIKQEIEEIRKVTGVSITHESSGKNIVCNKTKEKSQCVQTDECISNCSVLNYKDEIFCLKEEILQYKEIIKSYETQIAEIIKQNLVFKEIIKDFKKEQERIKNEESEVEAEEKHIKHLEENIQLLKENMMQNTGKIGTNMRQTVERMKKEISELKSKSLIQVSRDTTNKNASVCSKNHNGYNIFGELISSETIETLQPKIAKNIKEKMHFIN